MCRFLAYKGPPIRLHRLIFEPPHSLETQSYQPREMLSGTVNVDGCGCGWYRHRLQPEPGVYRSLSNLWSDLSFQSIGKIIATGLVFSAVRNATPPSPIDLQSVQPFALGPYLYMHNGHIERYHEKLKRSLQNLIPDDLYTGLYSPSDSAVVFALLYDRLRQRDPSLGQMEQNLRAVLATVADHADQAGVHCQINLALTDGHSMVFARYSNVEESNSLYLLKNSETFPGACVVASEPLTGETAWQSIEHNTLLSIDVENDIRITPIEI